MIRSQPLKCVSCDFNCVFEHMYSNRAKRERTQKGEDSEGNYHVGKEEQYRTKGDKEEGEDAEDEVEEEVQEKQETVEKEVSRKVEEKGRRAAM